jgi:NADPH2:quinone reductase
MKAMMITAYGPPETLQMLDVPDPIPGLGEVSVDVEAAAVGFIDVLFRRGDLDGMIQLPFIPGLEVAGRIRQLGADVRGLEVGQRVVTLSRPSSGGYAEIALASASNVVPLSLPNGRRLEPEVAVSTIPNVVTALGALRDAARLRSEDTLLVLGAAGGLASVFPGVAKHLGAAKVTGVVSRATKLTAAKDMGYDEVILVDELDSRDDRYDVIVDPVGGALRAASMNLLKPLGRLLVVGNASGAPDTTFTGNQMWFANTSVVGFAIGPLLIAEPERARPLADEASDLVAANATPIPIEAVPFSQAADAHRRLEARVVSGKLVLTRGS